jgi:hypothetical protein
MQAREHFMSDTNFGSNFDDDAAIQNSGPDGLPLDEGLALDDEDQEYLGDDDQIVDDEDELVDEDLLVDDEETGFKSANRVDPETF